MNYKNRIWLGATAVALVGAFAACTPLGTTQNPGSDCYTEEFGTEYCDSAEQAPTRDLTTQIAIDNQATLEAQAKKYAAQFTLSEDQGMKIAKTIHDYSAIRNRSDQDVADFARRLYGVNPNEIIAAAGNAALGDNSRLNALVDDAAKRFDTTPENMKKVIKTLHGKLLQEQGIQL